VEAAVVGGVATARFESHEEAERCVAALRGQSRGAHYVYNATHYSRDRGEPYSGWCTAEQGWSSFVAAHLARVERRAELQLPERFTHAQARRAKVTDISGGETHAVTWDVEPTELLEEAFDAIENATFVGKGDREFVQYRLAEFEWIIRSAMLLATEQAQSERDASVEPATAWRIMRGLRRLRAACLASFSTRRNASGGAASSWQRNRTSPMLGMTPLSVAPLIRQGSGSTAVAALSQQALAYHEAQDGVHAQPLDVSTGHSPGRRISGDGPLEP